METRKRMVRKMSSEGEPTTRQTKKRLTRQGGSGDRSTGLAARCLLWSSSLLVLIIFATGLWSVLWAPRNVEPQIISLPPLSEFIIDAVRPNRELENALRLFPNELMAPESIVLQDGRIYASTADGKVVEIVNGKITNKINIGKENCEKKMNPEKCGRPLGMRAIGYRKLIIADAYYGLCEVDFNKNSVEQLLSAQTEVDGKPMLFINDLDIFNDTIFFTHSSTRWNVENYNYILLAGIPDGRLMAYDPASKTVTTILDNLLFPNGVQVSSDGRELYVAETAMARVLKLELSEMPHPTVRYLVENLYGLPDNLRLSSDGDLWIACAAVRTRGLPNNEVKYDWLGRHPRIRGFMIKFIPRGLLAQMMDVVGSHYGLALLVAKDGRYKRSLHDADGKAITEISEVADNGTHIFFGSYRTPGIAYIPVS